MLMAWKLFRAVGNKVKQGAKTLWDNKWKILGGAALLGAGLAGAWAHIGDVRYLGLTPPKAKVNQTSPPIRTSSAPRELDWISRDLSIPAVDPPPPSYYEMTQGKYKNVPPLV